MPWQKGQSGNPGGLSKGSRRKLTDAFIRALRDWKAHGEEVIQRVREKNPAVYFKCIASLLPKDVSLEGHISETPSYLSLPATEALLERVKREINEKEATEAEKERRRGEQSSERDELLN